MARQQCFDKAAPGAMRAGAGPALLLLAALVLGLLASCSEGQGEREETLRPVRYEPVYASGVTRVRSFAGTTEAGIESRLSFKVPGTVQRMPVEVGARVRAGDLIAALDPRDYEIAVEEAEAGLAQARANLTNADSEYQRVRALYENRNASKGELDRARAAYESARAALSSAEKRLESARLRLDYTTLEAPVDGAISATAVDIGENVGEGQPVAVLTSGQRPKVRVGVPEQLIGGIREGDEVKVSINALSAEDIPAVVTEVGVAASAIATTFPVTVQLREPRESVRPGMSAEVAFTFSDGRRRARILVPPSTVLEDRRGRFVYLAEPLSEPERDAKGEALVKRRDVLVGELTDEGLEIVDGLEEGDLLITAGMSRLDEGLRVRLPRTSIGGAP